MNERAILNVVGRDEESSEAARLDAVFFALSDPVRRAILERLDGQDLLVSELAQPFDMSLQAVSRHIQVLVRAGILKQARSGRISRCSLEVGPIFAAAVWMNRYSKYWQAQFDLLAGWLQAQDKGRRSAGKRANTARAKAKRVARSGGKGRTT